MRRYGISSGNGHGCSICPGGTGAICHTEFAISFVNSSCVAGRTSCLFVLPIFTSPFLRTRINSCIILALKYFGYGLITNDPYLFVPPVTLCHIISSCNCHLPNGWQSLDSSMCGSGSIVPLTTSFAITMQQYPPPFVTRQ